MKKLLRSLDERDLEWKEQADGKGKILEKTLNHDPSTGASTKLAKFLPGYEGDTEDDHELWEEVYYLEGELIETTRKITYRPGMYECIPPHTMHGPYSTKVGCLLLEVYYQK